MSRITPCLWFKDQAEEAAHFYVSILPDSRIDMVHRSAIDTPGPQTGDVLLVDFTLAGQKVQAINGGIDAEYGLAVSMSFSARGQDELDQVWNALLQGGKAQECGWLADRYGLHWQILYEGYAEVMADPAKAKAAMTQIFKMVKLDIATIERAVAEA